MNIDKIINNSKARESRNRRPFNAFVDLFDATELALKEVSKLGASEATKETLLKSHLINAVTAVEVYYRDILDSVFRLCNPLVFENKLKKLHDHNYKINDLINIYVNRIHPLELVASNLSFQSVKNIDKTFTILLEKPFLKQVKQMKWRLKEKPEIEYEVTHNDIENLQSIFEERHQLIHNPNAHLTTSMYEIKEKMNSISLVIMASDLVLTQFINEHHDK